MAQEAVEKGKERVLAHNTAPQESHGGNYLLPQGYADKHLVLLKLLLYGTPKVALSLNSQQINTHRSPGSTNRLQKPMLARLLASPEIKRPREMRDPRPNWSCGSALLSASGTQKEVPHCVRVWSKLGISL